MRGILAIDQATVSGWAFAEPGEPPVWGHKRMGRAGATEGEVFFAFRLFLLARVDAFRPRYLVMEAPFLPRPDRSAAAKALNPAVLRRAYGFAANFTAIAEEFGICCYEKQSVEVVKFFTGKGRSPGFLLGNTRRFGNTRATSRTIALSRPSSRAPSALLGSVASEQASRSDPTAKRAAGRRLFCDTAKSERSCERWL